MSKIKIVSARKLIKFLESKGFKKSRQVGSHVVLVNKENNTLVVPLHPGKDLGRGIITSILKDAKIFS